MIKLRISWAMLFIGLVGFIITFPLWLLNIINDRTIIGITLVLSWAALWYEAFNAIQVAQSERNNG